MRMKLKIVRDESPYRKNVPATTGSGKKVLMKRILI